MSDQVPFGALVPDEFIEFSIGPLSQTGTILSGSPADIVLLQVGDEINYPAPLNTSVIVYDRVTPMQVKAYPAVDAKSVTGVIVRRNLTVFVPPRAEMPENPVWEYKSTGLFAPLETANRLVLRVSDKTLDSHLQEPTSPTVVAFVSDYGAVDVTELSDNSSPRLDVAALVASWNPDYVIAGGNSYGYGTNGSYSDMNSPYAGFVDGGKLFPVIGDQDFAGQSATSLLGYVSYFNPPGWNTPNNLVGNNGRYYSAKIGQYIEIFCLSSGWNSTIADKVVMAEGDVETFEPGGLSATSPQYLWLKSALAKSTATWKLVVCHFPPYSSAKSVMPGFAAMRWPFKEWGATAVLSGHSWLYERLDVDGLTYFVGGWSGAQAKSQLEAPYAIGSKQLDNVQYGAIKLTATDSWLKVEAISTANNIQQSQVDTVTFWASGLKAGFQKLEFKQVSSLDNTSVNQSTPALRYNDTEYVDLGKSALARVPRHEAEVYILIGEDARYRKFSALPFMPNGCRSLVYDKWLSQVRWYSNVTQDIMMPAGPSDEMVASRQGQTLEFIGMSPQGADSEYWRQKAAQIQVSPCHERTVQHLSFPAKDGIPYTYDIAKYSPITVGDNRVIFTTASAARVENLPVYSVSGQSRSQWLQVNFLVEPARTWYQHANTWSQSDTTGIVSVDAFGMVLPPASVSNAYQLATNIPTGAWMLNLPAGSYDIYFEWTDLNGDSVPLSFTVRWNSQIIHNGQWSGVANALQLSPACRVTVTDTTPGLLTLTLNGPRRTSGVRVSRFKIARAGTPDPVDYRFNLSLYDSDSGEDLSDKLNQTFRFSGAIGVGDVISSAWINISDVGDRETLSCELRLLDAPDVAIAVTDVELRTRIKVDALSDWRSYSSFRESCLAAALNGIQSKYSANPPISELRPNNGTGWDSDTTAKWLEQLVEDEPRLLLAFRQAAPGDIGRPALVPAGVYFDGAQVISTGAIADCTPTLEPWQPWMKALNFPVAMEDFWVVEEPAKPVKLVVFDPTGEDLVGV